MSPDSKGVQLAYRTQLRIAELLEQDDLTVGQLRNALRHLTYTLDELYPTMSAWELGYLTGLMGRAACALSVKEEAL